MSGRATISFSVQFDGLLWNFIDLKPQSSKVKFIETPGDRIWGDIRMGFPGEGALRAITGGGDCFQICI